MAAIRIEQMGRCEVFGTEPESKKLVSVVNSCYYRCYRIMCKMLQGMKERHLLPLKQGQDSKT